MIPEFDFGCFAERRNFACLFEDLAGALAADELSAAELGAERRLRVVVFPLPGLGTRFVVVA